MRVLVGGLVPSDGGSLWAVIFNWGAHGTWLACAGRRGCRASRPAAAVGPPAAGRGSAPAATAILAVVPRVRANAGRSGGHGLQFDDVDTLERRRDIFKRGWRFPV